MMKKILLGSAILFFFISCGVLRKPVHQPEITQKTITKSLSDTLYMAQSYIEMGQQAEEVGDSLGADYFYNKAMDYITVFRETHPSAPDSASLRVIQEVSLEYARYLARLNGIEQDTLTAANVMKVISALQDSLTTESADTSTITIPDVLEEKEKLTIPLELNKKVENAMRYFQGKGRKIFTKWLQRAGKYKNLITRILKEEGVPTELFYLAMIESGFNPRARSYARAVGMWQFISSTGRAYGLQSSWWYDERMDPEKSTRAAAKHLKDLHERFNHNWYLAIAGYNYSPKKIEWRMQRYKVEDFWSLPRLPRQTRNYVPTFIAAAIMAKEPEKYGFFVEPEPPLEYDTVTVRECVDLNIVAQCVDTTFEALKNLNPALLRWCTPPDRDSWVLNIPKGTRQKFLENYAKVPDDKKLTWIHHLIRSGETLSTIARHYGVSVSEIKRFNKIRGSLILAGHSLVIPVPQNKKYARALAKMSTYNKETYIRRKPVENVPGRVKYVHQVKKGETLWDIAIQYGVSVSQLRNWNGLGYTRIIHPGQKLNVWLNKNSNPSRPPDHTYARVEEKKTKNIQPKVAEDGKTIIYTVRQGDTLWDIASQYGVSIRDLKRWNNRRSNLIQPGDRLKIIVPE